MPRRVAVVLSIALGIALVAGLTWLGNVEPLSFGNTLMPIRDRTVDASTHDVDAFGVSGKVNSVHVDPGTTFRYDVTITNSGSFPVTIQDIATGEGPISRRVVAFAADPYYGGEPRTLTPFQPFRLAPDQFAFIEMEVHVRDDACLDRTAYTLWSTEPVTYNILGITRHSDVDTRTEIRVWGKDGPTPGCG